MTYVSKSIAYALIGFQSARQERKEEERKCLKPGFRSDFSWPHVPVFDRKGQFRHDDGVVQSPGLSLMGIQFLHQRKSALIDGAGDDARDLSEHLVSYLNGEVVGRPSDLS